MKVQMIEPGLWYVFGLSSWMVGQVGSACPYKQSSNPILNARVGDGSPDAFKKTSSSMLCRIYVDLMCAIVQKRRTEA